MCKCNHVDHAKFYLIPARRKVKKNYLNQTAENMNAVSDWGFPYASVVADIMNIFKC